MSKWTKKDTRTVKQQIDHYVLFNRMYYPAEVMRRDIESRRVAIVCGNLIGFGSMLRSRAEENQRASDHFREHPSIYGESTPEMVERFAKLAAEDSKGAEKAEALALRVEREGLPEEASGYLGGL